MFTFKEGLLSRAAHDLQFDLGRFQITLEGDELRAELALDSLRLVGPVEDGATRPERYDAARRADVERAMRQEVLHLDQHPTAHFTGRALAEGSGYRVEGQLQLAGRTAPLAFDVDRRGSRVPRPLRAASEPMGHSPVPRPAGDHPPARPDPD